ncbi:MAG: protein jag [Clostridia bacterium]|nr:protein jag [Clostridia bacterium]
MKETIKKGKTVDEAVQLALDELGCTRDDVLIDVLSEGKAGLFGIGSKEAEVRVTLEEKSVESVAAAFLQGVTDKLGLNATINTSTDDEDVLNIDISGDDMGAIIGRRGETLSALQYLTSLVVNRGTEDFIRVSLDTENYKQRREQALIHLADKTASKVVRFRRSITLEPMNPYERRIIHSHLQGNGRVSTYSTGVEPARRVVVALKRD